jgi:hypothetical protein
LASTAPEHVEGYVPAGDDATAVVVQVGAVVSEAAVSPLTNPLYEGVIAGTAAPYTLLGEDAVIVSGAVVTVAVPATYEME